MFFFLTARERKSLSMCQLSNYRQESSQCAFLDHLKTLVFSICESDDSCFWNAFFFSIAFFQLENQFFVNAGSALDEVSTALWSALKQVWQQAASLLSSWCNHLNRSNHAVARAPLLRTWGLSWIESPFYMYRIDFDNVSKQLQLVSNLLVSKRP